MRALTYCTRLLTCMIVMVVGPACLSPGQVPATAPWDSPTNAWVRAGGGMLWGPYQTNRTPVAGSVQFDGSTPLWHNGTGWVAFSDGGGYWSSYGTTNIQFTTGDVYAPYLVTLNEAYDNTWNGSTNLPTKDAVYDKIETLASVYFNPSDPGNFIDGIVGYNVATMDGGNSGSGGPFSQTMIATTNMTIDMIVVNDLQSVSPNQAFDTTIYLYGDDFTFTTSGPSGTILWQSTDGFRSSYGKSVEIDPMVTLTNGQQVTWLVVNDQSVASAPTWNATYDETMYQRYNTNSTYFTFPSPITRHRGGTNNYDNSNEVAWFPTRLYDPTYSNRQVTSIIPSDSLTIEANGGELSIEARDQPLIAVDSLTDAVFDFLEEIGYTNYLNGGTAYPGWWHTYEMQQDVTINGLQLYTVNSERGQVWNWYISNPSKSHTYVSGILDDTGGTGNAWLSFMLPEPFTLEDGVEYAIGIQWDTNSDIDQYAYETTGYWTNTLFKTSGYYIGGKDAITTQSSFEYNFQWRWLLNDYATVGEPVTVLESGEGMTFNRTGNVLSMVSTGGPNVSATFSNLTTQGLVEYGDTFWDDLRFPVTAFNPPGVVVDPDWVNVWGSLYLLGFDASTDESVMGVAQFPHTWAGTDVLCHVHLTQGNATLTSNVVFGLEYEWAGINTNFTGTTTTVLGTNALHGTAYRHELHSIATLTPPTGADEGSSMMIFRLFRDADNASDDATADVYLMELDFHYEIDKPGSDTYIPD